MRRPWVGWIRRARKGRDSTGLLRGASTEMPMASPQFGNHALLLNTVQTPSTGPDHLYAPACILFHLFLSHVTSQPGWLTLSNPVCMPAIPFFPIFPQYLTSDPCASGGQAPSASSTPGRWLHHLPHCLSITAPKFRAQCGQRLSLEGLSLPVPSLEASYIGATQGIFVKWFSTELSGVFWVFFNIKI